MVIRIWVPVTGCLYRNKNLVLASVHKEKTGDQALSLRKKGCYRGVYIPTTFMSGTVIMEILPQKEAAEDHPVSDTSD